jgi:hypothetical protein
LNQKLRKLVQQLGEAIHESVSESPQIAGVVADIRRQGFEVMLMLEATIGLNEVEEQPQAALDAPKSDELDETEEAGNVHGPGPAFPQVAADFDCRRVGRGRGRLSVCIEVCCRARNSTGL